jgi:1-acyl-sn-glycerol-3-phosphate acyltransferase
MSSKGIKRAIGRAWLSAFGWRVEGSAPDVPQAVLLAAPHTSNWDLPFTLACAWVLGLDFRFVAKHTLFEGPAGGLLRAMGGIAVDRRSRENAVDRMAGLFAQHDKLILAVAAEGTRGSAKRWKTGFYWIARAAKVPIVMGFLDYGRKVGGMGDLFWPSGDPESDLHKIRNFYGPIKGKYPKKQGAIVFRAEGGASAAPDDSSENVSVGL